MRIGSLFSGAGGLDMAAQQVFGGEIAWHCENDSAASKVLAHHWPDVPNLSDITAVDWAAVEPVDVLCGGYPCQPFSSAGQKKGTDDVRHLWPHFAEAIRRVRPRYAVLENVPRHRAVGFDSVLADLARMRYDAQWCSLRASDIGAPHRRERLFCIATDTGGDRRQQLAQLHSVAVPQRATRGAHRGDADGRTVDAIRLLPTPRTTDRFGSGRHGDGGLDLRTTVAERAGTVAWRQYGPAVTRWESLTRPAPDPRDPVSTKINGNPRISPAFSEWMLGWPAGHVTQVPGISRNDQLRIIGNGVVPQQATAAIRYLLTIAQAVA